MLPTLRAMRIQMGRRFRSTAERRRLRTFSGIQPTGPVHLGNYFGAIRPWAERVAAKEQESRDSTIFSIVDLHALTLPQNPAALRKTTLEMAASLIACGLDPERCILFQQSRIPQHLELCWILTCMTTVPALSRLSQYKEKSATLKDVPLGLFIYPVLQAADILLYKSDLVPVGEDNLQNVEVARRLARSFNNRFQTSFFPEPSPVLSADARVKSLRDPSKKMSKSEKDTKSCIYITDDSDSIVLKCKKAVTDHESRLTFDPEQRPGVSNLVSLHARLTETTTEAICQKFSDVDTGRYKMVVAEALIAYLKPIREKIKYLLQNRDHLEKVLQQGCDAAVIIADDTLKEVKKTIGIL